jgi:predicted HAD superfamily phosphohydrolase YqeG
VKIIEEGFFHEMNVAAIRDAVVILDIDGTLTCSSCMYVEDRVRTVIALIRQHNAVYVFSNNYNNARSRRIAADLDLAYIESPHKKPNTKILKYIDEKTAPMIAIGDKYLTDGLFAYFINAQHIRVRRYHCANDSIFDKTACLFDDVMYRIARMIGVVRV